MELDLDTSCPWKAHSHTNTTAFGKSTGWLNTLATTLLFSALRCRVSTPAHISKSSEAARPLCLPLTEEPNLTFFFHGMFVTAI